VTPAHTAILFTAGRSWRNNQANPGP